MNHQGLLDSYALAQRTVICHFSLDIERDERKLCEVLISYAAEHGLRIPDVVQVMLDQYK